MDSKKRRNYGILGSFVFHILVILLIAFTGILHSNHVSDDIVEIAFFGGGGGGGSGDTVNLEQDTETNASEAEAETVQEEIPMDDAIVENNNSQPKPVVKKQVIKKSTGKGTGQGSGNGSGIGPGSGSGSGGGNGSGIGTGNGSGIGAGNGVSSNPAIPPRIVKSVQPSYPLAERNAKIQGTAIVRLLINTNGTVDDVTLVASSGNANLDASAVQACYKWRFTSARNSAGQNIRCYANMPITFKIR